MDDLEKSPAPSLLPRILIPMKPTPSLCAADLHSGRPLFGASKSKLLATTLVVTLFAALSITSAQELAPTTLILGSSPGACVMTAQLNEKTPSATFKAIDLVPANATFTIAAGNAQAGIVSTSLDSVGGSAMKPLVLVLKDASGTPLPRVQINWQVTQGNGTLISSCVGRQGELTPSSASSVTDSEGLASMGLILGDLPGPQAVRAEVLGGSQSVSLSATAVLAAEDHIIFVQDPPYGAKGDGVTDDQPAIQKALDAAKQYPRARVVFEQNKIYRLVATPDGVRHLTVDAGGVTAPSSALSLIGNGATLRSDVSEPGANGTGIISGSGKWQGMSAADPVIIHGFTFESTHGMTVQVTDALGLNSRNQADAIKHIKIFGNTFKNFARHIDIGGSQDVTITQNTFLMEKGWDSGAYTGGNVCIWMYPETGAGIFTRDTYVTHNFYDGLSALHSTSEIEGPAKACGDGFIFGSSLNYVVTGNRIINFSYEGIYICYAAYRGIVPLAEQTATVTGNFLDGGKGGGWGIRTSYNNTLISNNVMINIAGNGILVTRETNKVDPPETSGEQILNNDITMRADAGAGINVGNSHSARIIGNTVRVTEPSAGVVATGIEAGGGGWHVNYDPKTNYLVDDLKLEKNVVQMKSNDAGSIGGTSIGILIWNLTTPFSVAGNQVMDADQGLFLKEQLPPLTPPYSRADYEAGNHFVRCIKNVWR